ncbi:MAG TPA: DnaJ domain-containing protein [Myxococcaceae bacterium]|nr:DnaJ domain-containing protein [Myxococcaceae bacterium]
MDSELIQIFIKNEQGQIWGPLTPATVELMLDNGIVKGRVMVSKDGQRYAMPGRFPDLRDCFPRELWGVEVSPDEAPPLTTPAPAPMPASPTGVPKAGPGATAGFTAGPGTAAFTAGPGARAAAAQSRGPATNPRATIPQPPPVITQSAVVPPSSPTPVPAPVPAKKAPAPVPVAEGVTAPPSSGDLSEMSAVKAYSLVAAAEMTALVTFSLSDREIHVHFRKGNPEYVGSTHTEDGLGAFLVKSGLAKLEQIAQAEAQKERFGGELLTALFGTGALNPGTAFAPLIDRAKGILMKALLAISGTFTVEPKDLPAQRSMPLGHKWAVLSELVRRMPGGELKRRLQSAWDLPAMKSGGRVPSSDLRLTPQETRALGHVDGVRSLAQFQKDMPQEYEAVLRVVFLMNEMDGISFAAVPSRPTPVPDEPPPQAAAPPKPAAPGTAGGPASGSGPKPGVARPPGRVPTSPRPAVQSPVKVTPTTPVGMPAAESIEDLRAMAARLKGQNHFEALGLHDKADAAQVKVAYFRLAKAYHPDTVPEGAAPELGQLKAEIFARVGDAYRTLSDEKLRAEYVEDLKHGGKGEQVDVSQLLLAEELFQKGTILVKARKWPEAVKMLDEAIKANAEEAEAYAWRGYAKFFANPDKKAGHQEALKDIAVALKRNERIASAHYFVGHIAKLTGDERMALKEFKRTVELNPDHIDAAREVRLMSGKK